MKTLEIIDAEIEAARASLAELRFLRDQQHLGRRMSLRAYDKFSAPKLALLSALMRWRDEWLYDVSSLAPFLSGKTQPESNHTLPGKVSASVDNSTGLEGQKSE